MCNFVTQIHDTICTPVSIAGRYGWNNYHVNNKNISDADHPLWIIK